MQYMLPILYMMHKISDQNICPYRHIVYKEHGKIQSEVNVGIY